MKRLLYKIRMWLLGLLHGEPEECADVFKPDGVATYIFENGTLTPLDYIREQRKQISMLVDTIALYKNAIREICRRSENTYYDWCCDQCACDCDKRNGWCNDFEPVSYGK